MKGDWLKLHRRAIESQVFSDPHLWHLFCWCLLKTNWKDGWFKGEKVPAGSFACGRASASCELGINPATWYKRMQKLESFGVISLSGNNRFTIVTVQKWALYQSQDESGNNEVATKSQQSSSDGTSKSQPSSTIEEGNNSKKERITHTHTPANSKIEIPPEIADAWDRWCNFRLAIDGRPVNDIHAQATIMELGRRGYEKAIRDIDFSIRKNGKTILDSDNDFERPRNTVTSQPKRKQVGI
jgi:hypothetical protein